MNRGQTSRSPPRFAAEIMRLMMNQENQSSPGGQNDGGRMGEVPPRGEEPPHSKLQSQRPGGAQGGAADDAPASLAEPMPPGEQPTAEHPTLEQLTPPGMQSAPPPA